MPGDAARDLKNPGHASPPLAAQEHFKTPWNFWTCGPAASLTEAHVSGVVDHHPRTANGELK